MKIIAQLLTASFALASAYADQPKLNEAQVIEMAKIIAKMSKNEQNFSFVKPKYDENSGVWSLSPRIESQAITYFLDIRDKDYHFRVGYSLDTGLTPKDSYKFRLPPDLMVKFKKIAKNQTK